MEVKIIIEALENLLKSNEELLPGANYIVADLGLLNTCRIEGSQVLHDLKKHYAKEDLAELKDDAFFLDALHQAGVDNWVGYEEAQDIVVRTQI